jgi:hypothetical protein
VTNHHWFIYWNTARAQPRVRCSCGTTDLAGLPAWRRHELEHVCTVCEGGASLEADATCDHCGRVGSCPDCAQDDCTHLQREGGARALGTAQGDRALPGVLPGQGSFF